MYAPVGSKFINQKKAGEPLTIVGDGDQRRDFTHIDDIVDALYSLGSKECWGYQYELGRGKNYSVNEVAQMMHITPEYREAKLGEARETLNQDQTASLMLDWYPYRNLEDYLKDVLN
jgi:UDP-glucose 4-epimerase